MKHFEHGWTTPDGKRIFARGWQPTGPPLSVINFIHDMGDHSGRYEAWGQLFAGKGYAFLAADLRGHGRSDGPRGHAASYRLLQQDIDVFLEQSSRLFPEASPILYGQGMGGNLAINYVIAGQTRLHGLIAASPWLIKAFKLPLGKKAMARFFKKLSPPMPLGRIIEPANLTRNREAVLSYRNDPLVHRNVSAGLFHALDRYGRHALRNVYRINVPFLLLHGSADRITSHRASEQFVMNTSTMTRFRSFPGAYHELHNEPERREVFESILAWLKDNRL